MRELRMGWDMRVLRLWWHAKVQEGARASDLCDGERTIATASSRTDWYAAERGGGAWER